MRTCSLEELFIEVGVGIAEGAFQELHLGSD